MAQSHVEHLCQVCGLPVTPDNCYAVLLGTEQDMIPAGNTVVEGGGLHGRCLRLSTVVCPPLASAFNGDGPMFGFVFAVHPADLAASYSTVTRNALWRTVYAHAVEHGRKPVRTPLDAVNVTAPSKETADA